MDVTLPNGVVINGVPEGTTKAQIQEMAIRNGMASMEDFGGASAPLDKPFYEMMPNEQANPSEAFTNPNLDLSGQTVETQEDVTHYVDGYNVDGTINPKSPRWKGMTPNQIIEARNQDVRDGVIDKHIMREGPAYDQNAQVANVSRDKGIADRQVELEENNPELSKQELFDKADKEQKIDGLETVGQAALMLTPAGHGIKGMAGMGALAGAGSGVLKVASDSAKGNRDILDSDNLIDVGEEALLGGVFGGVIGSVLKGAEKLVSMLKKSPTATDEIVELAKEYGIELTPGQKVSNKTIKHLEEITADGFGGRSIINTRAEQSKAAERIANENASKSKSSFIDEVFDNNSEVKRIKESLDDAKLPESEVDQAYTRLDDLYEEASRKVSEDGFMLNAVPRAMEKKRGILSEAAEKAKVPSANKTPNQIQSEKDWSDFQELENSPLLKSLQRKEFGEDVWATLRSGASKDSKVEKFSKFVGDDKAVKKAMTTKFMDDAVTAATKSGTFSIQNYTKFLKQNGSALKHFDKDAYKENKGLVKLMEVLAEGEKATASAASQGPWAGILSKLAPSIVGGTIGGLGGGVEGAVTGMASGAISRAAMAKVGLPAMSRIVSEKPFKFTEYLRSKKASKLLVEATEANSEKLEQLIDKLLKGYLIYSEK